MIHGLDTGFLMATEAKEHAEHDEAMLFLRRIRLIQMLFDSRPIILGDSSQRS